jgi:hydrogenase maturation protease
MKTLILGLGNDILTDDGVGLHVIRQLKTKIDDKDTAVAEASLAGLGLLDLLVGYETVIVVDAIQTKQGKIGEIYRLDPGNLSTTRHMASTHNVNFASALEFGRQLGLVLPEKIIIFAVEVADVDTFSEECTPPVKNSIPRCVDKILKEIIKINRLREA